MIVGIPKEIAVGQAADEKRVSLSPAAVGELTGNGITVVVEKSAGDGAHSVIIVMHHPFVQSSKKHRALSLLSRTGNRICFRRWGGSWARCTN